jgi:acetolactate synthase-1/3 small subunit
MRRAVFSLLVENSSGVLSRVSGLFSRRGYNIDSLTVGETLDPKYSKMTVTATGDDDVLEQIEKQLAKLIDVKEIVELPAEESVCRELILIKVKCDVTQRSDVVALANIFHARILDVSFDSVVVELTGEFSKLGAFVELLNGFEIIDIARTGLTGLSRGFADIK